MKKLHLLTTAWLIIAICAPGVGQAVDNKGASAALHEARFHIYDYETRQAIAQAIVYDKSDAPLGQTDVRGDLILHVPAISTDAYTVKANGYSAMVIRLTQATSTTSDYDVFLPKADKGAMIKEPHDPPSQKQAESDLVKVYVRQDPSSMKPSTTSGDQPVEFAVQLSATSRPITDKSSLKGWEELGPVFIHSENGLYKVRIGPYSTQEGAKQVLLQVKAKGKKDAFIVVQKGIENHVPFNPEKHYARETEPFSEEKHGVNENPVIPSAASVMDDEESIVEYKVRLVSFLKPGGFNTKDVDQYGTLESYRKGEWTILMIGGFTSEAEAERVRGLVTEKGFKDASVVVVRDGLLKLEH